MDDVTALRDALGKVLTDHGIAPNQNGFHSWRCENPDLYPDYCHCVPDLLTDLIAAVEARDALTPERLAKALHDRGLGCWEPRGPNGYLCWEVTHGNPLNDLHTPAAERILAALATDEAVS